MTLEQLLQANELIDTVPIKGKPYATVFERIKAFRNVAPNATIETEIIAIDADSVTMKAVVYDEDGHKLGVGHAQELKTSSFVNETSYVENCETSAVGRALGMCAVGIDKSFASADELANALLNQGKKPEKTTDSKPPQDKKYIPNLVPKEEDAKKPATIGQISQIESICTETGVPTAFIAQTYGADALTGLTRVQAYSVVNSFDKFKSKYTESLEGIPFK